MEIADGALNLFDPAANVAKGRTTLGSRPLLYLLRTSGFADFTSHSTTRDTMLICPERAHTCTRK